MSDRNEDFDPLVDLHDVSSMDFDNRAIVRELGVTRRRQIIQRYKL